MILHYCVVYNDLKIENKLNVQWQELSTEHPYSGTDSQVQENISGCENIHHILLD